MTPGVIVVPTGSLARYPVFWTCLANLQRPKGTVLSVQMGGSVAENRNRGIRDVLLPNAHLQWAWFIDDDHAFEPDVLLRLLARERDIVIPVTPSRSTAAPIAYQFDSGQGYRYAEWATLPTDQLVACDGAGGGGLLVTRRVFEAVPDPWFALGQLRAAHLDEDLYFFRQAKAAGFPIVLDPTVVLGHVTPVTLWPTVKDGAWTVEIDLTTTPPAPGMASLPPPALTPS